MNLSFLISLLTGEAADAARRVRTGIVVYLLAAAAAGCGLVFLLIAAFIHVSENLRYGPLATALGFGAGFLVLALLLVAVHRFGSAARAKRLRERRRSEMKAVMGAAALTALPSLVARGGSLVALAVPAAIAAVALAIYRENSGSRPDEADGKDD